ncbi:hypothetical protein [Streptomyces sp. CT34]|uniref:hypothetical protein n=1 Tax=Streptomyces sp. CT34 TaxID=1553907 RepID=UPI0007C662B1|nr:hypothetical protein [Streptomyces sp. CT34]
MDLNLTAEEEALVFHLAALLRSGRSPTNDDLADELGDEVRPLLQSLLEKGWLTVNEKRELTLSVIARLRCPVGRKWQGLSRPTRSAHKRQPRSCPVDQDPSRVGGDEAN